VSSEEVAVGRVAGALRSAEAPGVIGWNLQPVARHADGPFWPNRRDGQRGDLLPDGEKRGQTPGPNGTRLREWVVVPVVLLTLLAQCPMALMPLIALVNSTACNKE